MPDPLTTEQREQILSLLRTSPVLGSAEIAQKVGVATQQVAGIKAYPSRPKPPDGSPGDILDVEAVDTAFGLERDLQNALRANVFQLDPKLTIIDEGKERMVAAGKIDITARDETGATVVIELKTATADRDAVGQILSYMGDLMADAETVRGILIARDFSPRALAAGRAVPNIQLIRYGFRFSFEPVSLASPSTR
jgi:endonuclease NucS-like protein